MTRALKTVWRRFRRSQAGSATVEFAIVFPAVITVLLSGIELGLVSLQHAMLECAVDITVREIRLGTGSAPQHDQIKDLICDRAEFISDCGSNLRLEMIQIDPRAWASIPVDPDCTDRTEPVQPVRNFVNGQENDLMVLRVCAMIDPIFPTTGLGKSLGTGPGGQFSLVSTTVFVQEPR